MARIQATKNYRIFQRHSSENRPLDLKKHKKLSDAMRRYGFLKCFPIVVVRDANGNLVVKDGQHRVAIAEELGLPVYWVEAEEDFDVAVINCAGKPWTLADYARKHAANGLKAYHEGIEFAAQHSLPMGTAFALLYGTTTFGNCQSAFVDGTFKVKDREWADSVAGIYGPLSTMAPALRKQQFIEACMCVCRVPEFDARRLLTNAERCREKLVNYGSRDAYLDMLETIYNFGRKQLVPLKIAAITAMRERNAIVAAKNNKDRSATPVAT